MHEVKYKELTVPAEDGRPLSLSYFVLTDESQRPERYGIKVTEGTSGEFAQAADLTSDPKRAYGLLDTLVKHTVTPVTLSDVVADWL